MGWNLFFCKMSYASRQAADDGRLIYVGNLSDDVRERCVVRFCAAPARFEHSPHSPQHSSQTRDLSTGPSRFRPMRRFHPDTAPGEAANVENERSRENLTHSWNLRPT